MSDYISLLNDFLQKRKQKIPSFEMVMDKNEYRAKLTLNGITHFGDLCKHVKEAKASCAQVTLQYLSQKESKQYEKNPLKEKENMPQEQLEELTCAAVKDLPAKQEFKAKEFVQDIESSKVDDEFSAGLEYISLNPKDKDSTSALVDAPKFKLELQIKDASQRVEPRCLFSFRKDFFKESKPVPEASTTSHHEMNQKTPRQVAGPFVSFSNREYFNDSVSRDLKQHGMMKNQLGEAPLRKIDWVPLVCSAKKDPVAIIHEFAQKNIQEVRWIIIPIEDGMPLDLFYGKFQYQCSIGSDSFDPGLPGCNKKTAKKEAAKAAIRQLESRKLIHLY